MGRVVLSAYVLKYFYHELFGYKFYPKKKNVIFSVELKTLREISGFRRKADGNCALLRYCATCSCNSLPTFRDNQSVRSSRVKIQNIEACIQYHVTINISTILQQYFTFNEVQMLFFLVAQNCILVTSCNFIFTAS